MNFSFRISWKSGWAKSRRQENRNTRTEAGNEAKRLPEVEKVEIELLLADGTRRYQCDPKAMRNRAELPWEWTANQEKFVTYEMFQFHKLREIFSTLHSIFISTYKTIEFRSDDSIVHQAEEKANIDLTIEIG